MTMVQVKKATAFLRKPRSIAKRDVGPLSPMPRSPSTRLSWGSLLLIAGSTWLVCLAVNFNGAAQGSLFTGQLPLAFRIPLTLIFWVMPISLAETERS